MGNDNEMEVLEVQFARVRQDEWYGTPYQAHPTDAGFDLVVSRDVVVHPKGYAQLPTNTGVALPYHVWGLLVGRSSAFYKKFLLVNMGVIDSGYRGEVQALAYNPGEKKIVVRRGERLFQMIIVPRLVNVTWREVVLLPEAERGEHGFGSSGGYQAEGEGGPEVTK